MFTRFISLEFQMQYCAVVQYYSMLTTQAHKTILVSFNSCTQQVNSLLIKCADARTPSSKQHNAFYVRMFTS